jgi:hypothetical protein
LPQLCPSPGKKLVFIIGYDLSIHPAQLPDMQPASPGISQAEGNTGGSAQQTDQFF